MLRLPKEATNRDSRILSFVYAFARLRIFATILTSCSCCHRLFFQRYSFKVNCKDCLNLSAHIRYTEVAHPYLDYNDCLTIALTEHPIHVRREILNGLLGLRNEGSDI